MTTIIKRTIKRTISRVRYLLWKIRVFIRYDLRRMFSVNSSRQTNRELYVAGKYPSCFVPCPPFFDICNRGSYIINNREKVAKSEYITCKGCYKDNGFVDYIE